MKDFFPDYLPKAPAEPKRHRIGLIGCGSIAQYHLMAAQSFGVEVVALADLRREAAEALRDRFFPQARVFVDHRELLACEDITVVEIATHADVRIHQIADALRAGKHVLSQKPLANRLEEGRELAELADSLGLQLGVNQNGRWSAHLGFTLAVVASGRLGKLHSLDMCMSWDHTFMRGTASENLHHLMLSDFAIHYFDFTRLVFAGRALESVFANAVKAPDQDMRPPMLANCVMSFGDGLATLSLSSYESKPEQEYLSCVGSAGTLRGLGKVNRLQRLEWTDASGTRTIELEGTEVVDRFRGSLGEFLRALEDGRPSSLNARDNLKSLELCFAAMKSADSGVPMRPV
ncbi:MAG: Gfo/Idh/MocA family oxidoreductase [Opitutales bacterium]|nr:Gfo/Idh/MocA family oxidoreductase [Opitutales bacterium]